MLAEPPYQPLDLSAVRLSSVTVVSSLQLPGLAPFRTASPAGAVQEPYVLCGTKQQIQDMLLQHPSPLYCVTEADPEPRASAPFEPPPRSPEQPLTFTVPSLHPEAAVGTICSLHVQSVPEMILEHGKKNPDAVALRFKNKEHTFGELLSRAESLARHFDSEGITREKGPIGLAMKPSDLYVIVCLACGLRRIVVCVLSTAEAVREYQMEKVGCQITLGKDVPGALDVEKLDLRADIPLSEVRAPANALADPVFVEWTSGSTGRPKAMQATMFKVAHWIRWREFHFPLSRYGRRVGNGLFFMWYWHIPLCQGGTLVVIPAELSVDILEQSAYLAEHRVDWVDCFTPGQIQLITELTDHLPVRHVMSSGEALPVTTAEAFLRKFPATLSNVLSTTENSADIAKVDVTLAVCAKAREVCPMLPIAGRVREGDYGGGVVWNNVTEVTEGGVVVHRGWNQERGYLTGESPDSFGPGGVFVSGDRGEWHENLLYIAGRVDSVVKVRGFRIDLAGVESTVQGCPHVVDCAVVVWADTLWACCVTAAPAAVKDFLRAAFPAGERPVLVVFESLPYSNTGKRERKKLLEWVRERGRPGTGTNEQTSKSDGPPTEEMIAAAFEAQLGRRVDRTANFFEEGGTSFKALRAAVALGIKVFEIYEHPTAAGLAAFLHGPATSTSLGSAPVAAAQRVAVAGLAVRVGDVTGIRDFWAALVGGQELLAELPPPRGWRPSSGKDGLVTRKGVVPERGFDLGFWGVTADAAGKMSREQRTLLELAYEALEDAGFDPFDVRGRTGVFLSGGSLPHLEDLSRLRSEDPEQYFGLEIGHDKDYVSTAISYRFNLHGPAETVQTACSSSLVAITRAVHALRLGLCEVAIAGGASFSPDDAFRAVDGMIWAADGVCRPFSDEAGGTVAADGGGVVILCNASLCPLPPYAMLEGVGVNNDGRRKAMFNQPSVAGQVEALRLAQRDAGIEPADVDVIEAHGTGTRLGDPIEAEALSTVFGDRKEKLLLGSVKGNVGHLNTAAGVIGFLKAVLCVHNKRSVPSLHAEPRNSLIDWEASPLELTVDGGKPVRRAGVSSFGIGGTNAHVIVAAADEAEASSTAESTAESTMASPTAEVTREALLLTSARDSAAAARAAAALDATIETEQALLARPVLGGRAFRVGTKPPIAADKTRPVIFLFPGHGGAYEGMGAGLAEVGLLPAPPEQNANSAADIVAASLSVADALVAFGVEPAACVGHSVGEWAAGAFAGVVTRADARGTAISRGELVSKLSRPGGMLAVRARAEVVGPMLPAGATLSVNNGATCVVSCDASALDATERRLNEEGLGVKRLTATAFHSSAIDPVIEPYHALLATLDFGAPTRPLVSTSTGAWVDQPLDADHWCAQLRNPVNFDAALRTLAERFPKALVIEVGPPALAGVTARAARDLGVDWVVTSTLAKSDEADAFLQAVGHCFVHAGVLPRKLQFSENQVPRVLLPPYPFDRTALAVRKQEKAVPRAGSAETHEARVYEVVHVPQSCAPAYVPLLPVLLESADLAFVSELALPPYVVVDWKGAQAAARTHGRLAIIGGGKGEEGAADLVWPMLGLLQDVARAGVRLDVFFLLRDSVRYACVRGLLRTARKEHPELQLRILTVRSGPAVFPAVPVEAVLEGGIVHAPRVRPVTPASTSRCSVKRAVVTGGTRGVGRRVAEWLLADGRAAEVVAVSRAPPDNRETLPDGMTVVACDVSADLSNLPGGVDLVIHCAGVIDDQLLSKVTESRCAAVLAAKVKGLELLRKRYPTARLVAFSSSSAPFGIVGQGTYGAANAYLDEVLGGEAVQWGGWGEAGMSVDHQVKELRGERFMPVADGLSALARVLDERAATLPRLVLDVDWEQYRENETVFGDDDGLLAELVLAPREGASSTVGGVHAFSLRLGPGGSWPEVMEHVVDGQVVFPAAGYVAWAFAALASLATPAELRDVRFLRPLELTTTKDVVLTVKHGTKGAIEVTCGGAVYATMDFHAPRPHGATFSTDFEARTVESPYDVFLNAGFAYGPSFAQLRDVNVAGQRARADLLPPSAAAAPLPICPGALDSALQLFSLLDGGVMGVPTSLQRVWLAAERFPLARAITADGVVVLLAGDGRVAAAVEGAVLAAIPPPTLSLHRVELQPAELSSGVVLQVPEEGEDLARLRARMREAAEIGTAIVVDQVDEIVSAVARDEGCTLVSDGFRQEETLNHADFQQATIPVSAEEPYVVRIDNGADPVVVNAPRAEHLGDFDVELRTEYWSLNFRDVLVAKGAIPTTVAGESLGLGGEAYGVVTRVGDKVESVSVGDSVIAVPPDGLGSYLVTNERWMTRAPPSMDARTAVAGTMAYATAWLALHWQARIEKGMSVLVHSAAGGVGLAAVHLALRAGCTVFATASTNEKSNLLLSLGVQQCFNSRDVAAFSAGVREATGGEGVDVVLNSLSGDAIPRSLELLRPFGHFLELGKRDQYNATPVSLAPFLGGLTYSAAHLDVLMLQCRPRARRLLEEVWAALPDLPPLPTTVFPLADLTESLAYMSTGRHIGKVLLRTSDVAHAERARPRIIGPRDDVVFRSLLPWGDPRAAEVVVVEPELQAGTADRVRGAAVVITRSRAVAALARKAGVATTVELRRWGPVKPGIIVHTPGRFVAVEEESGGDFDTWLVGVLRDLVGTDVDPERSFESYGLDSLAQIGLARRITVKIGRAFGVTDLADHPTINAVCKALQDRGPARTPSRAKVLCLHGFRTNKDIFHLQLAAILRTAELSAYDIVFVNAPRVSTGPHDPQIPREVATYEWWGVPQETYEDAWRRGFAGFEETRAYLRGLGPFAGVMGFSQGAAVAIFVQAAWTALFSAVMPPPSFSKQDQRPSFHCYDEAEPVADECRAMTDLFASPTVVLHHEGHRVSKSAETVNEFERFLKERSSVVTS